MIAYHGGPFSDATIAAGIWRKHHAMISFARPEQLGIAAEYASSFVLDNGACSLWKAGQRRPAWDPYYRWVEAWRNHPGFDLDVIDGSEAAFEVITKGSCDDPGTLWSNPCPG